MERLLERFMLVSIFFIVDIDFIRYITNGNIRFKFLVLIFASIIEVYVFQFFKYIKEINL